MVPFSKKTNEKMIRLLLIVFGLAVDAFGVAVFVLPYKIIVGGATGIGSIISHVSGLGVTECIWMANGGLFLLTLIFMGWKYASTIILGSFLDPFFMTVFQHVSLFKNLTDDPLVAAIFAGLFLGAGVGIVLRAGGSTGGSDVIPVILHTKFGFKISNVMYVTEITILLIQMFYSPKQEIMLGILMTILTTVVMDRVLLAGGGEVQFLVFSRYALKINDALLKLDVGTTMFHGTTGYRKNECETIICVVPRRKMNAVKSQILEIDPLAFMTVSTIREVSGRGFSLDKRPIKRIHRTSVRPVSGDVSAHV